MELARQLTWSDQPAELFHYPTRDKIGVDAVLENRRGQVVGVEVKASSTIRAEDFRGLRHLAERLDDDFVVGIILYTWRPDAALRRSTAGHASQRPLANFP